MSIQDLYTNIEETLKLGEKLVFQKYCDSDFDKYQGQVKQIIDYVLKTKNDKLQIRTCELIMNANIEEFRFNIWKRIFSPYWITGKIFLPKNTDKEIKQRYILSINNRLPILVN